VERALVAGQEAVATAGTARDWWNSGEDEAQVLVEIWPPDPRFELMTGNMFGLLGPIGRIRGYRGIYPEYSIPTAVPSPTRPCSRSLGWRRRTFPLRAARLDHPAEMATAFGRRELFVALKNGRYHWQAFP
jgi:hypothetical protein